MRAIILAAGEGKRLRPLTQDCPKCMVSYQGYPLIDYILSALNQCGVHDIAVVHGYQHQVLEAHLQGKQVSFFHNGRFEQTNMAYSLFCAEEFMQDDDLIITYSDILYGSDVLQVLVQSDSPVSIIVDKAWQKLWQLRFENPLSDAETLKLNDQGHVVELGKKPTGYEEIEGQYIGLIKIAKEALSQVRRFYHQLDRNEFYDNQNFEKMYMTSFLQCVIEQLMPVQAVAIEGGWVEFDTLEDIRTYETHKFSFNRVCYD